MEQFTFTGKQRIFSLALILIGVISMAMTFFGHPEGHHARFWTNFLHNSVFFTGIAFISVYLLCAHTLAYSGWHTLLKRLIESFGMFLPLGAIFFLILWLGTTYHWHHLYHWAEEGITTPGSDNYDRIIAGKAPLLNKTMYFFLTVGLILFWSAFTLKIRSLSKAADNGDNNLANYKSTKFWMAVFMPVGAFTSAFFIWLSVMSIDAHWYSTMFAWYTSASWLVSACALLALFVIYLNGQGYLNELNQTHRHDLGKYIFAFSVFWTYVWFDQFMLIWYANVGEETIYFNTRLKTFKILFFLNLGINFLLPFFVLMRNSTKWKIGSLGFVAIMVFFGHWLDFFMMVKPGIYTTLNHGHGHDHGDGHGELISDAGHHAAPMIDLGWQLPGLLEIGTMLGFLGLFLFVVFTALSRAGLHTKNDPYYEESLHHHS